MALVLFGNGVASMRGSIGGTTFSKNKGGSYARNKTTPVNPATARQTEVRTLFGGLSSGWSALTPEEQMTWIEQAPNYPRTNVFGDPAPLTGQGLFNSLNGQLIQLSLPIFDLAFPPTEVPVAFFADVVISAIADTIEIVGHPATTDGTTIAIYATAPQSGGKNFVKSEYRLVAAVPEGTGGGTFDLTGGYVSRFGISPVSIPVTSKVFVKVRKVLVSSGQVSPDFASDGTFIHIP